MQIVNLLKLLILLSANLMVCGQFQHDIVFLDEEVFVACHDYPDNFIDTYFDLTNLVLQQTDEGGLLINGYAIVKSTLPNELPVKLETFKKERGAWQPTLFSSKRASLCKSTFDASEIWHSYLTGTPQEQQTCPFTEGQRLDFDIASDISFNIPMRNVEGEYYTRVEIGHNSKDGYMCTDVFYEMHKV